MTSNAHLPPHSRGRQSTGAALGQGRGARAPAAASAASLDGARFSAGQARARDEDRSRVVSFDCLRDLVPLSAVLARYGLLSSLRRSGSQLKGCCPLHDGTSRRQFVVNVESNTWYCFGSCQAGGGTLEFVAAMERVSLVRAGELVARWFALPSQLRHHQQRRPPMSIRPTHKVLAVTERRTGDDTKSYYTKIGVAFPIKNGAGLSLQMDALPLNGRLIVLEITDDEAPDEAARPAAADER